jgi:ribonuclease Y
MSQFEEKMLARQEKLDDKLEKIDQDKQYYKKKLEEITTIKDQQITKLEEVAALSQDQAKEQLFTMIEQREQSNIKTFVEKFTTIKKEEADKQGAQIIARVLPRLSSDIVSEYASAIVDVPTEDYKGKLIGRE